MLPRSRAIAAAAAISLVFVTGCGAAGDDPETKSTTTTTEADGPTSTTVADEPIGDNGIADLSAEEILDEATTAMLDAGSVQVTGSVTDDGSALGLDLGISRDGAAGTIELDGDEVHLVVTEDTVYMQGDESFYESIGGSAAAKLLGDRWLSVPVDSEQGENFAEFGDFDSFVESLLDPGEITKGDTGTIDGTAAIAIEDDDTDVDEPGELWVATEGKPYPLQINKKGSDAEKISLTAHGEDVDVSPPPADDVIDLEDLQESRGGRTTTTRG